MWWADLNDAHETGGNEEDAAHGDGKGYYLPVDW